MIDLVRGYDLGKWTENLYNTWLWVLAPVIADKPQGYPSWMRSALWRSKDLSTALASWAELRHDTILYVKQSDTHNVASIGAGHFPPGSPLEPKYYAYVEPVPELFARMGYMVEYLKKGLADEGVLTAKVEEALGRSVDLMKRLEALSHKELKGKPLKKTEYEFLMDFGDELSSVIEDLVSAVRLGEGGKWQEGDSTGDHEMIEGSEDAFKVTLVADVHTEGNTKKVLEIGTGKLDWLLVAHLAQDGRIGLAVGPVLGYYEFPWPMDDRLTDEKWRMMLDEGEAPLRPDWVKELLP